MQKLPVQKRSDRITPLTRIRNIHLMPNKLRVLLLGTRQRMGLMKMFYVYALLFLFGLSFALPFVWMLSTSLKPSGQVFSIPPTWFTRPLVWQNMLESLTAMGEPVHRYFFNSTLLAVNAVIGTVISSAMVAFAFARLEFPGKKVFFLLILSTLMIPFAVTMIPQFILWRMLGWLDTYKPLMVPAWLGGGPFFIFLLRQFFLTIPKEYDEAAKIDGAPYWDIFWRIILPLSKPALATVAVFTFVGTWNDFMGPLIIISSRQNFTLALYLAAFNLPLQATPWNLYMAAATIMMAPTLILYFFAQKLFIQGITLTGIKG